MEKKVPSILKTPSRQGQGYNCVMSFWEWIGIKNGVNGIKSEEELALKTWILKVTQNLDSSSDFSFSCFVRMWLEPVKTTDAWFSVFLWILGVCVHGSGGCYWTPVVMISSQVSRVSAVFSWLCRFFTAAGLSSSCVTRGLLSSCRFLIVVASVVAGASQVTLVVKNLPAKAGDIRDWGLVPRLGRSPGGGNGNPLQYSCLENPIDRGTWRATVHGVTKSWTRLKRLPMHTYSCMGFRV